MNIALLIIIASYLIYLYFFDCRQVKDERRELIRLKSLRVSQKVITALLLLFTLGHFFQFNLLNTYIVAILVVATCISEVLSKIYFERQY